MSSSVFRVAAMAAAAIAVVVVAGCGDDNVEPTKFALSVGEQGKKASFDVPKTVKGGLVEMTLSNDGKKPHSGQLIRVDSGHTSAEALKIIGGENAKTPDWIHAEGGVGTVGPGRSGTTTVNLPAGNYFVADIGEGPPSTADFKVTSGEEGDLPDTDATVVADKVGKDKYKWEIDGLKAGQNTFTFDSKGKDALHHIVAAPIKEGSTIDDVKKALESNQGPPPIDEQGIRDTAVLDGDRSEVTTLDLKPGRYAFICFLTDRDGGKEHFKEGMLKEVEISK